MTESVLNTFKIQKTILQSKAFNLLQYLISSFLKNDLNQLKYPLKIWFIERINYKKSRFER